MRVIKESLWQELADITDKTQLEWRGGFQDLNHHGVYHSGEVVGLGNLVCEKCHHHIAVYTPEVLPLCPNAATISSSVGRLSPKSKSAGLHPLPVGRAGGEGHQAAESHYSKPASPPANPQTPPRTIIHHYRRIRLVSRQRVVVHHRHALGIFPLRSTPNPSVDRGKHLGFSSQAMVHGSCSGAPWKPHFSAL